MYEAFDPVMKRKVSIEAALVESPEGEMTVELSGGEEGVRRTIQRGQNLGNLSHPNIVKVLACENSGPAPFLVFEHVEGSTLAEILAQRGKLPLNEALPLLREAAQGVDYANQKGFVHRNITPDNVLVGTGDQAGEVKIKGFEIAGAAYFLEPELFEIDPDLLMHSVHHMAPEFLLGDTLDGRADQFSFAVVAFQTLTGTHPFEGSTPMTLLGRIAFEGPSKLNLLTGFPPAVRSALARALDPSPDKRFSGCTALCEALAGVAQKAPESKSFVPAPAPAPPPPVAAPISRVQPIAPAAQSQSPKLLLLVGVLVAILAVGAYLLFAPSKKAGPAIPEASAPASQLPATKKQAIEKTAVDITKGMGPHDTPHPGRKPSGKPKERAKVVPPPLPKAKENTLVAPAEPKVVR